MKKKNKNDEYKFETPELDRWMRQLNREIFLDDLKSWIPGIIFIGFFLFGFLGTMYEWAYIMWLVFMVLSAGCLPFLIDWETPVRQIQTKEVVKMETKEIHHYHLVERNPKMIEVKEVSVRRPDGYEVRFRQGRKYE